MTPWCIGPPVFGKSYNTQLYQPEILWAVYFPSAHMFPTKSSLASVLSWDVEAVNAADEQTEEAKWKQHKWKQAPHVSRVPKEWQIEGCFTRSLDFSILDFRTLGDWQLNVWIHSSTASWGDTGQYESSSCNGPFTYARHLIMLRLWSICTSKPAIGSSAIFWSCSQNLTELSLRTRKDNWQSHLPA